MVITALKKKVTTYIIDKFIDILLSPKTRMFLNPFIDITYRIYERYLFKQITSKSVPKHIAIIPDGNRRWAKERGLNPVEGHYYGYEKMKEVIKWIYDLGVDIVTIYALSHENCLYRSKEELNNLFDIIKKGLIELKDQGVLDKYRVRLKVFGKLSIVRKDVVDLAKELEALTSMYDNKFLNIAICYGGRQEILDAIKAIVKDAMLSKIDIDRLTEDILRNYLSTSHLPSPEPDLVIRTSGELRISNFLLWQIAYSELYFCDVYWPDFRKIDLYRAIRSYQSRERRYGR